MSYAAPCQTYNASPINVCSIIISVVFIATDFSLEDPKSIYIFYFVLISYHIIMDFLQV